MIEPFGYTKHFNTCADCTLVTSYAMLVVLLLVRPITVCNLFCLVVHSFHLRETGTNGNKGKHRHKSLCVFE